MSDDHERADNANKKSTKRFRGILTATNRLAKEDENLDEAEYTNGKPLSATHQKLHHDKHLHDSMYRVHKVYPKMGQSHPTAVYHHSSGHVIEREHDTKRNKVGY